MSTCSGSGFEESKFTYLSNQASVPAPLYAVLKNQNLHISQTGDSPKYKYFSFEESKFTYLSNGKASLLIERIVLKNQNLHISQTLPF